MNAGKRLLCVIGEEGAVEVFRQRALDHYESLTRIPTASGARTGLFVPAWNRLFIAAPHRGSESGKGSRVRCRQRGTDKLEWIAFNGPYFWD
jgi:hypothetical protein